MQALMAAEADSLENILDPDKVNMTATELWAGLNARQYIGQVSRNIFWSWPCRRRDCRAHAPGDLWLQTKEQPEEHGHFECPRCVRAEVLALQDFNHLHTGTEGPHRQDASGQPGLVRNGLRELRPRLRFRNSIPALPHRVGVGRNGALPGKVVNGIL